MFIPAQSFFSKLPMRQLTRPKQARNGLNFSKLPMRQLTSSITFCASLSLSKLPMRQLTLKRISELTETSF